MIAHSVIGRLVRRLLQETKSPKSPANTLVFESLEPRLLLAADPLSITVIEAEWIDPASPRLGIIFPLRRQRIGPLAEICRRGLCGRSIWRLGADRRGADRNRVRGRLEDHGRRSVHGLEHRQQRQLHLESRRRSCRERATALQIVRAQFPPRPERRRADRSSTTVIESDGSTTLTEVANHFFLYDGSGRGPSLKYAGADFVAGQFGAWAPIGAEQTATGYEVAWKITGADQYTVWNTDSTGNYISNRSRRCVGSELCAAIARAQFPPGPERRRGDRVWTRQ